MSLKPFIINSHGRIVFPGNFFPELDFSVFKTLKQFAAVIRRDFGEKALTDAEIAERLQAGEYKSRYELCRDLVLNRFWVNRYTLTMYEKRPIRWGDLPRHREDVFLPVYKARDSSANVAAFEAGYQSLPASWDEELEDRCFGILSHVFRNKLSAGGELRPIRYTVPEASANPANLTRCLLTYDPDYVRYSRNDVVDCLHPVPELEALMRQCMILHNQYPWDPAGSTLQEVGKLKDEDYVVAFYPRTPEVFQFIQRVKQDEKGGARVRQEPIRPAEAGTLALSAPIKPYPAVQVNQRFAILPRIEAIATYEGEVACTNADLIRNHAYCWSRMTATEICDKTGIEQRRYTELPLEEMALIAAKSALAKSGRKPAEIGAVLFCSCTSSKLIPSVATWLSGELGLFQTHNSSDIVAACAGMPYGMAEAVRLLQEIERPVLLVCAEKFSDKIGTVRTSRMIFGDGAAAVVIAPAPEGTPADIEVFQTYGSGPWSEVNSIIWPNPEFDNNITVYGPEVKALVTRYLKQMMSDLTELPSPNGAGGALIDDIDLVVPHQANKNMVLTLAEAAGIPGEKIFFNIEHVGNTSSASILMAVHDAVREGRIDRPMRIFAPGFGAGAVGGYVVMRVDPAVVSLSTEDRSLEMSYIANGNGNGNGNGNYHSLTGKVALVTGASRGIGRAIAVELARRGANIALNFRSDTNQAEIAATGIRELGVECLLVQGDVAKKGEATRIVKEVLDRWQRLDILVNNAGITRDRSMRKMTDDDWAEVINVNLNGTFYCTSAVLPAMTNQRFGRIINISSVVGQMGAFGQANYSASKGGIIAFTKTLALEMAKFNVTANAIAPGFTSTEMVDAIPEEIAAQIKAKIPLGRFATPEEIAKAAAFLAAEGDYITGQELNVNGGYHM